MITPPLPQNETSRLEALKQFQILDTAAEQEFDDLTRLASLICGTPISTITLIDSDRQWFKSVLGLDVAQTPRNLSICAHTILQDDLMVVPDATKDERFADNPFITGEPHVRFYAGTPLITLEGQAVGALCVIDTQPRHLSEDQFDALRRLGRQAGALLESRLDAQRLRASQTRYHRLFETSQDGILVVDALSGVIEDINPALCRMLGYALVDFIGQRIDELEAFRDITAAQPDLMALTERDALRLGDLEMPTQDGRKIFVELVCNVSQSDAKTLLQCNFRDITERKQDEIRLRESESNLAKSQQMARLGSWQLDLTNLDDINTNPLQWSDELFRIFGYEPGEVEVSNELFFSAVHPEDRAKVGAVMEEALRGGAPYSMVHRITRPDGSERVVESQAELVYNEQGRPVRAIGLGQDITERTHTEEALRRSEALFRTLINSSWDGFHLVAPTGEILYESPAVTRMLGYHPEEMVGHNGAEFLHPDDLYLLGEGAIELLATPGYLRTVELRVRHKDGSWRWVESFEVNLLSHPDVGAVAVNYRDITERKHAEEERDRFFTLSLDMLGIIGIDGYFKRLNPAFSATLGYSEAELLAQPFLTWVHPDDAEASFAVTQTLRDGEPLVGFENRYLKKDGTWCWIEWKAVALQEEDLIYTAARDVTARKEAEAKLSLDNEQLERRVMERTTELAVVNESLHVENLEHRMTLAKLRQVAEAYRAAQQEAEAASRAKSEFLSRMSHELRTPLNAIIGFGQILQSGELEPEQHEQIGQMLSGGWHLLDLINEVLDISRVEAGNLDLSLEVVPLREVLAQSCALVSPLAAQRKVVVEGAVTGGTEHYVIADRQRLKQVLINLISNGIKYNRDGGRVSFSFDTGVEGKIRLAVRDTGQGLSVEDRTKLFVAFERLGANESGIDGTGLGLVLSRHLLTSMGGGLGVESTLGVGSTFWVELQVSTEVPAIRAVPEIVRVELKTSHQKEEADEATAEKEPVPLRSLRVLVAEDNLINQRVVAHQLKKMGHVPTLCADGRAAVETWSGGKFDLVLMDCRMPNLDGYEATAQIRQLEAGQGHIPIIALTANALLEDREKSLAAGMDDHVSKPISQAALAETLQRWGSGKEGRA